MNQCLLSGFLRRHVNTAGIFEDQPGEASFRHLLQVFVVEESISLYRQNNNKAQLIKVAVDDAKAPSLMHDGK